MEHFTIVNNRIVFPNHSVKCCLRNYSPEYVVAMGNTLNPVGTADDHRNELFNCQNDGTWTVWENKAATATA
jgi:hypothetical protein